VEDGEETTSTSRASSLPRPRKEVPWGGPFRQPARVCQKNRAGCGIPEGGGEDFASRSRDSTVSRSREVRTCPHVRDAIHTTALRGTPNTWQANVEKRFKASTSLQKLLPSAHFARTLITAEPTEGKHCRTSLHLRENVKAKHGVG
jgi:hypothetical protein